MSQDLIVAEYHRNPYRREAEAHVEGAEVGEAPTVLLSPTILYPQGGGQQGDRGYLVVGSTRIPILDTRRGRTCDGSVEVRHIVDPKVDPDELTELVGADVGVVLDWDHRYRQMRLHSVAHLTHLFIASQIGVTLPEPRLSQIHDTHGVNRWDDLILDQDLVSDAVAELNRFCAKAVPIECNEDSTSGPGRRLWTCAEWTIPCGGIHPLNTAEIDSVSAVVNVKKGRSTVTFRMIEPML